jgi:outer membrane lipoprotein-sorting protein
MNTSRFLMPLAAVVVAVWTVLGQPAAAPAKSPQEILALSFGKLVNLIEPATNTAPQTLTATVKVVAADGAVKSLAGHVVEVAFQAPDKLRVAGDVEGRSLVLGRDGQQLWIFAPQKNFGLVGATNVARFTAEPNSFDTTPLAPVTLPLPKAQLLVLPLLFQVEALPDETVDGVNCHVVRGTPLPQARDALNLPNGTLTLWARETDGLPARLRVANDKNLAVTVEFQKLTVGEPWPEANWRMNAPANAKVETVALAHLRRFLPAAWSLLTGKIPTLGPATGERKVIATEGAGRLEDFDGTKVLFLKGTPEDMGRQQGTLMRKQVRDLVDKVLYGVGVGSSFEKRRWFFGEVEEAQQRITPFIDERYLREMDAMALAANLDKQEVRLANFFPELFHCSGFSVFGRATVDGRMYHGRILDYMRGVGLEPNAVVIVSQPDRGYAWVNISYAGFIGSVTAMNEKHISIGEMGGRGEGNWDGKPMAELVRDVMEKTATLDEAVDLMRKGPRTCEYYYVISDGSTKRAVGIAATPTSFEVIHPGQAHPRLPHAIPDAVLMSAGDRYEELARRVQAEYGRLDADAARHLMDRPVCMNSNLHSVLFAPETLDFWVANADARNVASACRYTHYNLAELLGRAPAPGGTPPATAAK